MSLNWSVKNVEDYEQIDPVRLQTVILLSQIVGMNEITEKNWMEFYARSACVEDVYGPLLETDSGPVSITPADIQRVIGYHSNANPLTKVQFKNKIFEDMFEKHITEAKKVNLDVYNH